MTLSYFCPHCGIKTEGNTTNSIVANNWNISCPVCEFMIGFYIHHKPTKTEDEIEKAFQDTPLTDKKAILAIKRRRRKKA